MSDKAKVIIAGSRDIDPPLRSIENFVRMWEWAHGRKVGRVLSGMARGVDTAGMNWAEAQDIPVDGYPADWRRFGKAAGPLRNLEMAEDADGLILIWDGKSPGSASMLAIAKDKRLPMVEARIGDGT